jgi:sodium-independent sulfate anion transporter 11
MATKTGHFLGKILGIKPDYNNEKHDGVTRGESAYSVDTADTYIEEEPSVSEWIKNGVPSGHDIIQYVRSLFPFLNWIGYYNLQWLYGDLVAGKCCSSE